METNQILCKETGKLLKADKIFKVKNTENNCIEEIVSYCTLCPHSENKKEVGQACKACYGSITQSKKTFEIKGSKKNMVQVENYRNKFEVDELGEYIRDMDADSFMGAIDKVANLNTLNWNHDNQKTDDKLRAYDKPKSWKTDCQMCKQKCAKQNTKTECEKAKDYLEEKFCTNIEFMSEKQLLSEIPNEFRCQSQAQTMYFV